LLLDERLYLRFILTTLNLQQHDRLSGVSRAHREEAGRVLIGSTEVIKVHELDLNGMTLAQLMPAMGLHVPRSHPDWLPAGTVDAEGHAMLSIHSWLIRHEGMTMLVDTGAGNDKSRPQQPVLDGLDNPFLDRLAQAGVRPDEVTHVLHTHIHSDHVGWNTRWVDGTWRPTFPNAVTICSQLEWRYGAALAAGDEPGIAAAREQAGLGAPIRVPVSGTFEDSMLPLLDGGRVRLVPIDGAEVLPGVRFLPAPGHSIDHAAIEIRSGEAAALFGGDVMHHPLEVYDPELVSSFCEWPDAARRSRTAMLEHAVRSEATWFSAHLSRSSAGRITRRDSGYGWTFVDG
jgi:glyoxylase-like metal-dependent hydrolase (beta-lactamase superfamily II)